ncbi:DEAD/DEAH box helicase [Sphingomonas endolithica]|uniref:DEAD/DEAH box helicase n=1 Tax=Sphingomonas endolithica TaxID=2972485 RepID=UPI0021AF5A82|nr:TRCF domain-containing protein [Sphingomonas sp. ZFBP2030]
MTNIARIATRIAETLETHDVVFVADDDQQADAIAAAACAILPHGDVIFLPSSDALPGDVAPASPANIGHRVAALHRLRELQAVSDRPRFACVMSGEASARGYPAPAAFDDAPPTLRVGDAIDSATIEQTLIEIGYFTDDRVDEPGEVAVRGEVIDIFPVDADLPVRIDLADGRIAAIRCYDPVTQRSLEPRDSLGIGRAAEPAASPSVPILAHITPGVIAFSAKALQRRQRFIELADSAAGKGKADAAKPKDWAAALKKWEERDFSGGIEPAPRFAETRSPLAALAKFATPLLAEGKSLVLAGGTRDLRFLRGKVAKRLKREIAEIDSWTAAGTLEPGQVATLTMPVSSGFVTERHVLIAAGDLLGSRAVIDDGHAASTVEPFSGAGGDIQVGDVVVHEDHGVAVVGGLEDMPVMDAGAEPGEAIVLTFAGEGRRLVPTTGADRIWRYGADGDAVALDKLDGSSWAKRRGEIDIAIVESARGLAALSDARAKLEAPAMVPDAAAYERFSAGFAFTETADQARAINAVRDDLAAGRPMDRLVIGDVGYGKTEIAMRAAALAALAGYQVAIAAPTTVLVRQHLQAFQRRFAAAGLTVAGLSRLSTAAERKATKAGLADGSIAIVVGTGAVMGKDVRYAKLGLVVIDEEQRFGAADKARLRGSGDVHLLTLSATPIPRTLQMALVGLQQISILATPPARRQPIRTSIDTLDDVRLRTALMREKGRGGQSFVVVPRISDMATFGARLRRIVPDVTVVEAHGKMAAADIDAAMVGFADGDGDVLLATNIIEAGLDVPRANTMVIWRADRFGLAQLHQLRGRVGRGNRRGQVMLLTDAEDGIGERTLKRLRTLAAFDRLGAGFDISAQDLDMRGGGDLLGETQAGHMKLIGVDLYQELLEMALRQIRGEDVDRWTPELNLGSAGRLPESWIPEPDLRLSLYVRLARARDSAALDGLEEEMVDRFGPLPPAAERLVAALRIGMLARTTGIARIDAGPSAIALTPRRGCDAAFAEAGLIEKNGRWLLAEETSEDDRAERVQALLEDLAGVG